MKSIFAAVVLLAISTPALADWWIKETPDKQHVGIKLSTNDETTYRAQCKKKTDTAVSIVKKGERFVDCYHKMRTEHLHRLRDSNDDQFDFAFTLLLKTSNYAINKIYLKYKDMNAEKKDHVQELMVRRLDTTLNSTSQNFDGHMFMFNVAKILEQNDVTWGDDFDYKLFVKFKAVLGKLKECRTIRIRGSWDDEDDAYLVEYEDKKGDIATDSDKWISIKQNGPVTFGFGALGTTLSPRCKYAGSSNYTDIDYDYGQPD